MRTIQAQFNRASLLVRLNVDPAGSTSRWGLTLEETRAMIRTLNYAVAEGEEYMADLRGERKAS